jgi:ABC-type amino acid transport substrate-binding protein
VTVRRLNLRPRLVVALLLLAVVTSVATAEPSLVASEKTRDLPEILAAGELRHLGVPYANFVTGAGDGMDVELIQLFAKHLGVKYVYVPTDWDKVITDVTGSLIKRSGGQVQIVGQAPVRGDLIANGLTVIPWRQQLIDYSSPTFPTQIWLVTRADSPMQPIVPGQSVELDISTVGHMLSGHTILCKANTCLDPALFPLEKDGAQIQRFAGTLNELAPAVMNGEAEATILDVPDALIALRKWSGRIKVIGPYSKTQEMAVGFPKTSPKLRDAFEEFLTTCKKDGTYMALVQKYYPTAREYYPEFFQRTQ